MASTLKLGKGNWGVKEDSLLAYSDQNNNFVPLPFDFSRASSATVVNKAGLVEPVTSGLPRIDFSDDTNGALLLEPQSTNLITYSELLNTYFTTKSAGAVITDNYGIAPNGLQSSSRIQFGESDYCLRALSLSTNSTSSVYVKGISGETIQFGVGANVAQGGIFTFNGSWQRIEYTYQNGSGSILFSNLQGSATATDFEAWGLQVEDNTTYATSYIPTAGATATRVQDICIGAGSASTFNSTEGVLYAEIETFSQTGTFRQINLNNGSTGSRIYITKRAENDLLEFRMDNALGNLNLAFPVNTTNQFIKAAFRYGVNNFAVFIDGVNKNATPNGNTFSAGTLNNLELNSPLDQPFFGKAKQVTVFPTALSDAELEALTTI